MIFTSESVTEGHPDKLADQISDAVLDAVLENDPNGRVACEVLLTSGLAVIAGEITTSSYVDIQQTVRDVIKGVGYDNEDVGFDGNTCGVMISIDEQSPEIGASVSESLEIRSGSKDSYEKLGAGDQGLMFGYACDETPDLMPTPIWLAHKIAKQLSEVRKSGELSYLRPDGKTQVSVNYEDGNAISIPTILVSTQHDDGLEMDKLTSDIIDRVIRPVVPSQFNLDETRFLINPSGSFVVGGPHADTGLTGRKIIVDTYGGMARHGGGAFSGKDATKVDRSGAYAARAMAKAIVGAGLASKCEIQVAYAIGVAEPVSICIEAFGTNNVDLDQLISAVRNIFDLRPGAIIDNLDLRKPRFRKTSTYGHFGRSEAEFTWEHVDKSIAELKSHFNVS